PAVKSPRTMPRIPRACAAHTLAGTSAGCTTVKWRIVPTDRGRRATPAERTDRLLPAHDPQSQCRALGLTMCREEGPRESLPPTAGDWHPPLPTDVLCAYPRRSRREFET